VCFQCAQCCLRDQCQENYQILFEHGLQSVCLNRDGEVRLRSPSGPKGSGKGPPGGMASQDHFPLLLPVPCLFFFFFVFSYVSHEDLCFLFCPSPFQTPSSNCR
jgi:hypothetical protein